MFQGYVPNIQFSTHTENPLILEWKGKDVSLDTPNRGHYITNPNFMHFYTGIPSKLPYIRIKSDPPKTASYLPLPNQTPQRGRVKLTLQPKV